MSVPEVNLFICQRAYPPYLNKFLIPKLIIEATILMLVIRAGIKNTRKYGNIKISNSLIDILVKDSILRFVV